MPGRTEASRALELPSRQITNNDFGTWRLPGSIALPYSGGMDAIARRPVAKVRQREELPVNRDFHSFTGLHDAIAQSVSPHFMVAFSDYGNVLGQLYPIHGLVGIGKDQAVAPLGISVFTHGP
jgi:hypothetical protein